MDFTRIDHNCRVSIWFFQLDIKHPIPTQSPIQLAVWYQSKQTNQNYGYVLFERPRELAAVAELFPTNAIIVPGKETSYEIIRFIIDSHPYEIKTHANGPIPFCHAYQLHSYGIATYESYDKHSFPPFGCVSRVPTFKQSDSIRSLGTKHYRDITNIEFEDYII